MLNKELLSKFKIGTVVFYLPKDKLYSFSKKEYIPGIGHVIGFGQNAFGEVLVKIKLITEEQTLIHPDLLQIVEI